MLSSHRCMVITTLWTIGSTYFFGGESMSWLLSMLVVNFTSMAYALAYEYEIDTAPGVGSMPWSELVFGFLTYGLQKTWKAVERFLFKKLLSAVWNRTGRRVLTE
ncbi:uncharacterized protein LOC142520083 [Primulina tabacum]|uniref:uncharacterized protein LOC142520083 n=1 Tax=Primulina tabacum TaxID=48773 RepID=UPI003F5AD1F7